MIRVLSLAAPLCLVIGQTPAPQTPASTIPATKLQTRWAAEVKTN